MEKTCENPFLRQDQFPDFTAMTPAAAREALPALLSAASDEVGRIEREAAPGWGSFVVPLDDAQRPLFDAWGLVNHLSSVCDSEEWRALIEEFQPQMVAFSLRCAQSRRFLELYAATLEAESDPVRRRIAEKAWRAMQLSGVGLEGEERRRFNEICESLARLSTDFRDCVLDATKAWRLEVGEADLEGLPAGAKEMLRDPDGRFFLKIDDAAYVPAMQHLRDRGLREKVYRARACRAPENAARIGEMLALRREHANLVGFASHAELSLETKCAPSVDAVMSMIGKLADASLAVAPAEDAELEAECPFDRLEPWDRAFYAERLRERTYSYSEEELSQYLDLPDVLRGLFALAERLFGVSVEERTGAVGTWHEDVRFFAVKGGGEDMAYFYLDPYVRPATKTGGAWMNEFRTLRPGVKPVATICCNFTAPDRDGRCLLRFREVETLFHEFGHALQHMLTTVKEPDAAGISLVDWDAVEVASQFMENWCTDRRTMRSLALSRSTREPIPDPLLEKVRAAKNFRAANACLRQLTFAKIDMLLHGPEPCDPDEVKRRVFREFRQPLMEGDRFLESFTHIFAGGYSAGYYSYKWSEVMSADCFGAFEEAGLDDEDAVRATGRRYRDTILALGGSKDPMEVFRMFRGRGPTVDALLRQQGLRQGK